MSRGGFLINRLLGITCEAIGYAQQFSLWPRQCPPGEGTRPTPSTKPCCCRPGALTRHPFAAHNENCWVTPRWQNSRPSSIPTKPAPS
jgi:uncharacterized protein YbdZ (MbtH family)